MRPRQGRPLPGLGQALPGPAYRPRAPAGSKGQTACRGPLSRSWLLPRLSARGALRCGPCPLPPPPPKAITPTRAPWQAARLRPAWKWTSDCTGGAAASSKVAPAFPRPLTQGSRRAQAALGGAGLRLPPGWRLHPPGWEVPALNLIILPPPGWEVHTEVPRSLPSSEVQQPKPPSAAKPPQSKPASKSKQSKADPSRRRG